jgi:hypothetical protein
MAVIYKNGNDPLGLRKARKFFVGFATISFSRKPV